MADGRQSRNSNKTELTPSANAIFHPGSSKTPEQVAKEAREDQARERSRKAAQQSRDSGKEQTEPKGPKKVTLIRPTKEKPGSEIDTNERESATPSPTEDTQSLSGTEASQAQSDEVIFSSDERDTERNNEEASIVIRDEEDSRDSDDSQDTFQLLSPRDGSESETEIMTKVERTLPVSGTAGAPRTLSNDDSGIKAAEWLETVKEVISKHRPSLLETPENAEELVEAVVSYMEVPLRKLCKRSLAEATCWEDIERGIFKLYPDAKDVMTGSFKQIVSLLGRRGALGDARQREAMAFLRNFQSEAETLLASTRGKRITPYQLVKWIEGEFDENFMSRVKFRMILNGKPEWVEESVEATAPATASTSNNVPPPAEVKTVRKLVKIPKAIDWDDFEDWRWLIEELMVLLNEEVDRSLRYGGIDKREERSDKADKRKEPIMMNATPGIVSARPFSEEINATLAKLADLGTLTAKHLEQQGETLRKIAESMDNNNKKTSERRTYNPSSGGNYKCYFDGGDHFIKDCEELKRYIKEGLAESRDGKIYARGGKRIPGEKTGKCWKDRLDDMYREEKEKEAEAKKQEVYIFQGVETASDDEDDDESNDSGAFYERLAQEARQYQSFMNERREAGF